MRTSFLKFQVEERKKMEGMVKFFNRKKGFGFISGDDGKDYFVHVSALQQVTFLRDNDRVSFNSAEGDRGLKAENVKLLQKASERAPDGNGEEPEEEGEPAVEEEESSKEEEELTEE